jgi:hypothetical protein
LGRGAKLLDKRFGVGGLACNRVPGCICDFLGKIVAPAKNFTNEMDHILGVRIVLAEDQGLGNKRAARK